jgi:hypothetical protein
MLTMAYPVFLSVVICAFQWAKKPHPEWGYRKDGTGRQI